jgi:WhiB family redox-sensing transcriptional regulator
MAHWTENALCKRLVDAGLAHPDDWWPIGVEHPKEVRLARRRCTGCPVWRECREYALANGEGEGIWGGLTARERRALVKQRAVA